MDSNLDIHDCDIGMELSVSKGVALGSVFASGKISIRKSSVKLYFTGFELVGIGTVSGDSANINLFDANILLNYRGQRCSAIAALDGFTELYVERIGMRVIGVGDKSLDFGGFSCAMNIVFNDTDINVRLDTSEKIRERMLENQVKIIASRYKLTVNGEEILKSDENYTT